MAALELLSTHDPDEQYLHQRPAGWTMGQQVLQEWEAFCVELQRCDQVMAQRNEERCSPCSAVPSCAEQVLCSARGLPAAGLNTNGASYLSYGGSTSL